MKKTAVVLILAVLTLSLFVSCHDCLVCGKSKLFTTKKTVLGRDIYICKDCEKAPENFVNDVKSGVNDVKNNIKDGVDSVKNDIKSIFK